METQNDKLQNVYAKDKYSLSNFKLTVKREVNKHLLPILYFEKDSMNSVKVVERQTCFMNNYI